FDGGNVDAWQIQVLRNRAIRLAEDAVRGSLVPRFPVPDVIGVFAIGTHERRARLDRPVRVDDRRQRIVLDVDGGDAIGGRITTGRDYRRDLLGLIYDAIGRQHHLSVAHQRRHHVQVVL